MSNVLSNFQVRAIRDNVTRNLKKQIRFWAGQLMVVFEQNSQ